MSKGFGNFMSKKGFHPGNFANRKRVQEAEEKIEAQRKREKDRMIEYQKQQEMIDQISLATGESKERLSLNLMYGLEPGVKKDPKDGVHWTGSNPNKAINSYKPATSSGQNGDNGPRIRLEWQRERPLRIPPKDAGVPKDSEPTSSTSRVKIEIKSEPLAGANEISAVRMTDNRFKVKREEQTRDLNRGERGSKQYVQQHDDYRSHHSRDHKRIKKER